MGDGRQDIAAANLGRVQGTPSVNGRLIEGAHVGEQCTLHAPARQGMS